MKRYLLLIMLLCADYCFSQSSLRVQHLSVEDGLSQSSVYSIFQDSYGYMWLATGDGLNRYDGKEFIPYKSKLNDSLPYRLKDRNINSLVYEDKHHNLWFTADEGLYCMNRHTGSFKVRVNKYDTWYAALIAGMDKDVLWLSVPSKGVFRVPVDTGTVRLYEFTDSIQMTINQFTQVFNGVNAPGGLWITDEKGVIYFDKKTLRDKRVFRKDGISYACRLRSGKLVFSATNGVWLYNPADGSAKFVAITLPGKKETKWKAAAEDTVSGKLYIGARYGGDVCRMDMATGSTELLHFQDNDINMMYIDRSQNLWIGTEGGGVYKLDIKPDRFSGYMPHMSGDEVFMVKSIYRDDSGDIWMGLFSKGIIKYNPATRKLIPVPVAAVTEGLYLNAIMKDSLGDMVVGLNEKIIWLDGKTNKVKTQFVLPPHPTVPNKYPVIYSILEWKKGYYLVGADIGLYLVDNTGRTPCGRMWYSYNADSSICGWIYNFYKAPDGSIYIGKRNGFAKVAMLNDTLPQLIDYGLNSLPIRHFYKSNTQILWIASEQGLIAYNETTHKYKVFDEATGIGNSYVYAILPQNDSTLWVSTNKGISQVNIHYGNGSDVKARFTNYTSKDGLQSNEFNTGAFYKCPDGTLMFGGIAGVNWFNPANIKINPYKAIPAISGVYVNDTLMNRDTTMYMHRLSLPYTSNTISFSLRALEYTQPEQNTFAYMLVGLDKDWVYTTSDKARYSNLPPGNYRFLLKVSNNENLWNDKPLELRITILPPYWQTWWFRLLVLLALAVTAFFAVRYYIRQRVLIKTRELEKQHALNIERIRISKDVHDDIGSGLSKISLLSEIANKKIKENQPHGKDISNITAISKELVDNMRDLIWVLNPENTTLDNLVSRIREYCADYLDGVNIEATFNFPEHVPAMNILREVQRNIFSTVKEAVNNAVKHSRAAEIKISVSVDDSTLSIAIADNGAGFAESELKGTGNGLRNMKQRIASIGGQCTIASGVNEGTLVNMIIPFSKLNVEQN